MTHCPNLPAQRNSVRAVAALTVGLALPHAVWAETNFNSGSASALAASARLDFRITIPRVLFLRVGTGTDFANNTSVDAVDFNVPESASGSGVPVAGQSGTAITARVVGNGNNISFSATGSSGGLTPSSVGAPAVPWTQIVAASGGGSLPHPAIGNGTAGAASSLVSTGGVVDQTSTWSFSYRNLTALPAGTYSGQVIYTAALP